MRLNWIDRAIAHVAPVAAAQRARARVQLAAFGSMTDLQASSGGYTSTSGTDSFMRRWSTRPRDAASDILRQLPDQRGQSRDLARNNPIAASALNTNVVRAIGTGLAFSPQPDLKTLGWTDGQAQAWIEELQAEFSLFADSRECDYWGDQNFYELQDLALRTMLESGDSFSVLPDGEPTPTMPYKLRVQVIEADRIGNPGGKPDSAESCGGVKRKPSGPVQSYHVYDRHPNSLAVSGDRFAGQWIDAVGSSGRRRMLHHFKKLRPESPRGVPYLAPVMGLFKLLGTYTDAEVKAAVVSAFLTVFVETETGATPAPIFDGSNSATSGEAGPVGPDEIPLGPGIVDRKSVV